MKPHFKTTLIPLMFYIMMLITVLSFWYGVHIGLSKTLVTNSEFIENRKDLKMSLKNQVEHVRALNESFNKTVEMERTEKK